MLDITLAPGQRHGPLTVFPLVARKVVDLPYQLLVDALHAGTLRITEVGSGTVPELCAINQSDAAVLVLDGEQLIGARQNRMTNRSILLPAHGKTNIPVSCMEHGRWHFNSEHFAPSRQHSPSGVRRQAREVEAARAASGAPVPQQSLAEAQGRVWDAIANYAADLGAHSDTGALDQVCSAREDDIERWLRHFPVADRQVGLLAFCGARPLGMDVIGGTNLYPRLHDRLLRGYVLDALGARAGRRPVAPEPAQAFLDRVRAARRVASPTVGQGSYRVLAGEVIGGELADGERVAHLSAFPPSERVGGGRRDRAADEPPIAPPSRRRGRDRRVE